LADTCTLLISKLNSYEKSWEFNFLKIYFKKAEKIKYLKGFKKSILNNIINQVYKKERIMVFKGVYTPAITVFDEKGNLDFKGNENVINHLINKGVNGFLFLGSIGEFFNLTLEERKEFIDFVVKTVNKRVPVLVGTAGTIVDEVVGLTRYAESAGADAAVVIQPYYFALDDESIYRFYAEVAGSTEMPIFIYNFPERTSVNLKPELVLRLARDFKNIVGIKDTVDNISHTRKLIQIVKSEIKDFAVFSGFDEYLVPNLLAGGDGTIGGLTNVCPEIVVKLYEAYKENNLEIVKEQQDKVYKLMSLYDKSQPFIGAIKTAAMLNGREIKSFVRKPAGELSQESIEDIKSLLEKVQAK
jgi:2-dehydro-3-deoxy-D-pentonate aldolase